MKPMVSTDETNGFSNETIGINGAKLPETPNFQNGTYRLSTDLHREKYAIFLKKTIKKSPCL